MSTLRGDPLPCVLPTRLDPDAPALVDADGSLSYRDLVAAVVARAAELGTGRHGRRLVHLPLSTDRQSVIGYLAAQAAGHVALVTGPNSADILARYPPDVRLGTDGEWIVDSTSRHLLHPDLTLLLSTSGSTGSPKLVRLSADNLRSNADAIVAALDLRPSDRAITSLPLHYCFGLAVLHSHLRAGAAIVLHPGAVTEPAFAAALARERVSTLAVTPHLVDVLRVQGTLDDDLPDLRLIAQAGGPLSADRVRELARLGRKQGWGLAVMYGQTEATARMAVLPPELAEHHPDVVGWPVGGSSFRVDGSREIGELVFSGPGVMLGYAEHPDDLALPRMITELRTGDVGSIDADGLVRIAGRTSAFVKIAGIRVDLGRVEQALGAQGITACVTGDDSGVRVCVESAKTHPGDDGVRRIAAAAAGIGPGCVAVRVVDELPRFASGKPDRRACDAGFSDAARAPDQAGTGLEAVADALAPLLGRRDLDPERSFAELGGDSFSHVQASIRLGRLLPRGHRLPGDWHHRPLHELATLVRRGTRSRRLWTTIETPVLLRALAVLMICGSHVQLFALAGGAHILLAIAGYHYARYLIPVPSSADRWRRTARAVIGIAVPALLVAVAMKVFAGAGTWQRVLLVNWAVSPENGSIFWFVECLLVIIVGVTAILSVPSVRDLVARDPWLLAAGLGIAALIPRYLVITFVEGPVRGLPYTVAWLFAAGMAFATANTTGRRIATVVISAAATVSFFPNAERNLMIMLGLVLLGTVRTIPLPSILVRPVGVLAAASLYVYLIQFQLFTYSDVPVVEFTLGLTGGLIFWAIAHPLVRRCQTMVGAFGDSSRPAPPGRRSAAFSSSRREHRYSTPPRPCGASTQTAQNHGRPPESPHRPCHHSHHRKRTDS